MNWMMQARASHVFGSGYAAGQQQQGKVFSSSLYDAGFEAGEAGLPRRQAFDKTMVDLMPEDEEEQSEMDRELDRAMEELEAGGVADSDAADVDAYDVAGYDADAADAGAYDLVEEDLR